MKRGKEKQKEREVKGEGVMIHRWKVIRECKVYTQLYELVLRTIESVVSPDEPSHHFVNGLYTPTPGGFRLSLWRQLQSFKLFVYIIIVQSFNEEPCDFLYLFTQYSIEVNYVTIQSTNKLWFPLYRGSNKW